MLNTKLRFATPNKTNTCTGEERGTAGSSIPNAWNKLSFRHRQKTSFTKGNGVNGLCLQALGYSNTFKLSEIVRKKTKTKQ